MDWIALLPTHDDEAPAWSWHGLQFTPRVARVEEALLLEVSGSARLFGGPEALRDRLLAPDAPLQPAHWAQGESSLVALALLRLKALGRAPPAHVPHDLPLPLLSVAVPHVPLLERTGCRTWGQLRALPRGPVARRFGAALLDALDVAWGERPERYPWLTLPEVFDVRLELPALATQAPELMWTAQRLLLQLQLWLRARQQGVLALELEWTLDLRRLDGRPLPSHEQLVVRTAQPAQETAHLRRLVGEQLARASLAAPVNQLRLRTLRTAPWVEASRSFLPEDNVKGDKLHQLVERLSARLGEDKVLAPLAQADWRPERMQCWASPPVRAEPVEASACKTIAHTLYPTWLLPQPLRLEVRDHRPWYEGEPLRLLTRRQRVETGWWEEGGVVVRDYCIARSERADLLWIYCEHLAPARAPAPDHTAAAHEAPAPAYVPAQHRPRWYLQGFYA
ncbi:MAG TPA: DNA polymerase Y family protein [Ramlibacter sp.]|nr:DNA polymerase Y family protein [Ramlibacter sp.]